MNVNELYLAWQDPIDNKWLPVGRLTIDNDNIYRFVYTKGATSSKNFTPLARMKWLDKVYTSAELFPLFSNRLLSDSRPEFKNYKEWLDIKENENNPLIVLAITEGIKGTDTFEVFQCPKPNDEGKYEVKFFVHGLRHLSSHAVERINNFQKDDKLLILPDIQNNYDSMALALRTNNPVEMVGYCPRYLSPDFYELLEKTGSNAIEVSVDRVNVKAPLRLRLLCKIVAPWPEGFQPCSDDKFNPIVEYDHVSKPLLEIDTPVVPVDTKYSSSQGDLSNKDGYDLINNNSSKLSNMGDRITTGRVLVSNENQMKNKNRDRRPKNIVANQLRAHGIKNSMSPESKGIADLRLRFLPGKTCYVQIKSRPGIPAAPSAKNLGQLKISINRNEDMSVIAKVAQNNISSKTVRSEKNKTLDND